MCDQEANPNTRIQAGHAMMLPLTEQHTGTEVAFACANGVIALVNLISRTAMVASRDPLNTEMLVSTVKGWTHIVGAYRT
jgi:hypothetical protein